MPEHTIQASVTWVEQGKFAPPPSPKKNKPGIKIQRNKENLFRTCSCLGSSCRGLSEKSPNCARNRRRDWEGRLEMRRFLTGRGLGTRLLTETAREQVGHEIRWYAEFGDGVLEDSEKEGYEPQQHQLCRMKTIYMILARNQTILLR